MNENRFRLALEQLGPGDWEQFERLASTFLASEYPNLRTTASRSGDGGRDAELFSLDGDTSIMFQYSVTSDWSDKISTTARTIARNFPSVTFLVYLTNQVIGSSADSLKAKIRKDHKIIVDVRDRSWFIERMNTSPITESAAEKLARLKVDPLLAEREVLSTSTQSLSDLESRAALVFLEMRWEDDTRDKGLTKLAFDALVTSALRNTDSEHRIPRSEIYNRVSEVVSNHPQPIIRQQVDSALSRASKKRIKHIRSCDEFHLAFEENNRIRDRLADARVADQEFRQEIMTSVARVLDDGCSDVVIGQFADRTRRVLDKFLMSRGEEFVSAVKTGIYERVSVQQLESQIVEDASLFPYSTVERGFGHLSIVQEVVLSLITNPGIATRRYLRALVDSYTLLAFLRETPDVQKAVNKMFYSGDIWLDTNIVLPLFSEQLEDDDGQFSTTISAATTAGLRLHVTTGVLEELSSHMGRCIRCLSLGFNNWQGSIPYLAEKYLLSGEDIRKFAGWIERFRGRNRPVDDIADYLLEKFNIRRTDLTQEADNAPASIRSEVQSVWQEVHDRRGSARVPPIDALTLTRLASHDVENYLGVYQRRSAERASPIGFNSWWVTFDQGAVSVDRRLRDSLRLSDFYTPVMAPDFLVNYLALGPARGRVAKETENLLPVILDLRATDSIPPDVITIAENVREKNKGLEERVIRRKVRDALDLAKSTRGSVAMDDLSQLGEDLIA